MKGIKGFALLARMQRALLTEVGWSTCTVLFTSHFKVLITVLSTTLNCCFGYKLLNVLFVSFPISLLISPVMILGAKV